LPRLVRLHTRHWTRFARTFSLPRFVFFPRAWTRVALFTFPRLRLPSSRCAPLCNVRSVWFLRVRLLYSYPFALPRVIYTCRNCIVLVLPRDSPGSSSHLTLLPRYALLVGSPRVCVSFTRLDRFSFSHAVSVLGSRVVWFTVCVCHTHGLSAFSRYASYAFPHTARWLHSPLVPFDYARVLVHIRCPLPCICFFAGHGSFVASFPFVAVAGSPARSGFSSVWFGFRSRTFALVTYTFHTVHYSFFSLYLVACCGAPHLSRLPHRCTVRTRTLVFSLVYGCVTHTARFVCVSLVRFCTGHACVHLLVHTALSFSRFRLSLSVGSRFTSRRFTSFISLRRSLHAFTRFTHAFGLLHLMRTSRFSCILVWFALLVGFRS